MEIVVGNCGGISIQYGHSSLPLQGLNSDRAYLVPPTSHQDQCSNSSKFNEKMLEGDWGGKGTLARCWNGCDNQIA